MSPSFDEECPGGPPPLGERPGLTAPDSMGAYLTFRPTAQTTDAERNCISNIRPEGLAYADAAFKLAHLVTAMRARQSRSDWNASPIRS